MFWTLLHFLYTVSNAHLRYSRGSSNVHHFISTFLGKKTHASHEHHCALLTIKVPVWTKKGFRSRCHRRSFLKENHPCSAALKNPETITLIWRTCKVTSRMFLISKEQYNQLKNPILREEPLKNLYFWESTVTIPKCCFSDTVPSLCHKEPCRASPKVEGVILSDHSTSPFFRLISLITIICSELLLFHPSTAPAVIYNVHKICFM